jgi:hypothetical protein
MLYIFAFGNKLFSFALAQITSYFMLIEKQNILLVAKLAQAIKKTSLFEAAKIT